MTYPIQRPPIIELEGITKIYDGRVPVHALEPSSLSIWKGDSVAIVGSSGSGKSTLLNILGLLDTPTSGKYLLEGIDLSSANDSVRGAIRGQKFGFVFQSFHLLPHRTVAENVELALMYASVPAAQRRERAEAALEALGILHRRHADPRELSGGERQRAAIARAICPGPEVIFCDEPTGNLDTQNTNIVMDMLCRMNEQGQTVIMVTHDLGLARLLTRTVTVQDGRIVDDLDGSNDE